MSINCLACTQSIVSRNSISSLPPGGVLITNAYAPCVFNPFYYWNTTSTTLSSNNYVIGCTVIGANQTAPYQFLNGTYVMSTSCLTTQTCVGSQPQSLAYAYSGEISTADQNPCPQGVYNTSGVYTGTVSTTVSGTSVSGEWMQIKLPYKLLVTTYNIMTGAQGGGGTYNQTFPKNFTLAGSSNGTTWTLIDSRTGYSATSASGINKFTAPTQSVYYTYFRLIGSQVGAGSFQRFSVAIGIQGIYSP